MNSIADYKFGHTAYLEAHPEITVAWGARTIPTKGYRLDYLGDRMSTWGDKAEADKLCRYLDEHQILKKVSDATFAMYELGTVRPNECEFMPYEGPEVKVMARANGGYVYLVAFWRDKEKDPFGTAELGYEIKRFSDARTVMWIVNPKAAPGENRISKHEFYTVDEAKHRLMMLALANPTRIYVPMKLKDFTEGDYTGKTYTARYKKGYEMFQKWRLQIFEPGVDTPIYTERADTKGAAKARLKEWLYEHPGAKATELP